MLVSLFNLFENKAARRDSSIHVAAPMIGIGTSEAQFKEFRDEVEILRQAEAFEEPVETSFQLVEYCCFFICLRMCFCS